MLAVAGSGRDVTGLVGRMTGGAGNLVPATWKILGCKGVGIHSCDF